MFIYSLIYLDSWKYNKYIIIGRMWVIWFVSLNIIIDVDIVCVIVVDMVVVFVL